MFFCVVIMGSKRLKTTVQEVNGKFTIPIPSALVNLLGIEKGNKFIWCLNDGDLILKVVKT